MRFAFCTMVLTICGCVSEHKDKRSESVHSPRLRFTRSLSQIEKGMAAQQVLALLGPPEDIRTLNDPGGISTIGTKEIWRYGTSGHLTIATLGQIYVDQDSRVQYICGKGEPPPEGLFEEEELRRFLIALDEVPSYQAGRFFNPRALIVAVNLLQPLGKERALAAIAEYLRVACELQADARKGAFLVLRVLFEVPEDTGYMPPMRVGVPGPPAPNDPKLLPRFPITIEGDIPFLLIDGYCLAGFPQPPEEHVKYFREHGKLRVGPLVPTVSPLEAIERFARSPRWIYGGTNKFWNNARGHEHLAEQLLRLLNTVYRVEPGLFGELLPWGPEAAERRDRILKDIAQLRMRWDETVDRYVFLDGSSLPESERKIYRRQYWNPALMLCLPWVMRMLSSIWPSVVWKICTGPMFPKSPLPVGQTQCQS